MINWVNTYGQEYPPGFTVPDGYTIPASMVGTWTKLPPGMTPPAPAPGRQAPAGAPPGGQGAAPPPDRTVTTVTGRAAGSGATRVVTNDGGRGAGGDVPVVIDRSSGDAPGRGAAPTPPAKPSGPVPPPPTRSLPPEVIPPDELPDYKPPFSAYAVRADCDDNLWIRTNPMHPTPGGLVYDIVNRQGELFDRLQIPPGHTLVGFGAGHVVYLSTRDATGLHLERVKLTPP
jgi:hypothetical protein